MKHFPRVCLAVIPVTLLVLGCTGPSIKTSVQSDREVVLPTRSCGDFFIVDALIEGRGPFSMVLDTGAGITILAPEVAEEIGAAKHLGSIVIDRFSAEGSIPFEPAPVDHLSRALGLKIEGILAYGVFEGVLLTYDYPNREVRIKNGAFSESELALPGVVPTGTGARPFIRASTDTQEFDVLLDTGASRGLSVMMLDLFAFESPPRPTGVRMRMEGMSIVKSGRLAGDVAFGPLTLERPIIHQSMSVNLVGQAILRNCAVTFDQINHRVRFARSDGGLGVPIETPTLFGPGIAFDLKDDRLVVTLVFEETPAQRAGLRIEDEILAIDGIPIAERGCEFREYEPNPGPRPVDYLVQHGGDQVTITILTDAIVR